MHHGRNVFFLFSFHISNYVHIVMFCDVPTISFSDMCINIGFPPFIYCSFSGPYTEDTPRNSTGTYFSLITFNI